MAFTSMPSGCVLSNRRRCWLTARLVVLPALYLSVRIAMHAGLQCMPNADAVGDGFHVFPVLNQLAFTPEVSPWLMFDYAAPKEFGPAKGKRRGVGQHPHRGFETVTIAFQGEVEHADSVGNRDVIGPGDVQWMTAGRGIVHEEFHSDRFSEAGGTFEMAQLWLNLPAKDKMTKPRYQPILAKDIPEVELSGGNAVRLIAGEYGGKNGPARLHSPVELFDIQLKTKGEAAHIALPEGHNAIVFVRKGEVLVGEEGKERVLGPQATALMGREGSLRLVGSEKNSQVLLLAGEPTNEPIAAQGPMVMNTQEQLRKAFDDFYSGKFGR